jgi:alanine dehydrogenase
MIIGIPKEIKILEGRVGLIPPAAGDLVAAGHIVNIESNAGLLSGYSDEDYLKVGCFIKPDAAELYSSSQLIIKVKEPLDKDLLYLNSEHLLFCFLHLAAETALLTKLCKKGLTAIAFETVEKDGTLPLLAPMSDIAGRVAVQSGLSLLWHTQGGKGILLGGLAAAKRGKVVILGAGSVGANAAKMAAAIGAEVVIFDRNRDKLDKMRSLGANVTALYPFVDLVVETVISADLLIGAVLIPGSKAPHIVSKETVKMMEAGSVIIDVAVDQGGCIESTQPTSWDKPTFLWHDIIHFGVTNMPGAVPRSASQALSAAIIPYALELAKGNYLSNKSLQSGINIQDGKVVHPALLGACPRTEILSKKT